MHPYQDAREAKTCKCKASSLQSLKGNSGMQLCFTCRLTEDIALASSNFGFPAAPEITLSHSLTTSCRAASYLH